jgi:hypothetical protein
MLQEAVLEQLLADLALESYLYNTGRADTLDGMARVWETSAELFTLDRTLELIASARDGRAEALVADLAAQEYLFSLVRPIQAEIAERRRESSLLWGRTWLPVDAAGFHLANEPDPSIRRALLCMIDTAEANANPLRVRRHWTIHNAIRQDLGFGGYIAMVESLLGVDLHRLREQIEAFLEATKPAYEDGLARLTKTAGISGKHPTDGDMAYITRASRYDGSFPGEKAILAAARTLKGLGIDLLAQENVTMDVQDGEGKALCAYCSAVRIPDDIRIYRYPTGGWEDYQSLLHEIGHAEYFANVSPSAPFPYRTLIDGAVSEGFAFLFESMVQDATWRQTVLEEPPPPDFAEFSRDVTRYSVRAYCTQFLFEMDLHTSPDPRGMARRFSEIYDRLLGVKVHPELYLRSVSDFFAGAEYLQGWILSAQLRRYLRQEYGPAWFSARRAGDFLKEMWASGSRDTADQIARGLGYDALDPRVLAAELI